MLEFFSILVLGASASFIGTMVGGSGLISIPGLIFLGLPAPAAIATDQVGLLGESVAGWRTFHRAKKIDYRLAIRLALLAAIGSLVGANILVQLPVEQVETLVGVLVLIIGIAIGSNKSIGVEQKPLPRLPHVLALAYATYLLVGLWGGLFGAGFGLLSRYILLLGFRKTFTETSAIGKCISLSVAGVAIPVFLNKGLVNFAAAAPLLLGMALGAHLGAKYALKIGDAKLRILFLIIVALSSAKLLLT